MNKYYKLAQIGEGGMTRIYAGTLLNPSIDTLSSNTLLDTTISSSSSFLTNPISSSSENFEHKYYPTIMIKSYLHGTTNQYIQDTAMHEKQILSSIPPHSFIVPLLDYYTDINDKTINLIFAYSSGGTLGDMLLNRRPLFLVHDTLMYQKHKYLEEMLHKLQHTHKIIYPDEVLGSGNHSVTSGTTSSSTMTMGRLSTSSTAHNISTPSTSPPSVPHTFMSSSTLVSHLHPLPLPIVLHVGAQLITSITYLHSYHIIHRDIQPDNIVCYLPLSLQNLIYPTDILNSSSLPSKLPLLPTIDNMLLYNLCLTDFQHALIDTLNNPNTGTNLEELDHVLIMDTNIYSAPELLREESITKAIDIWSFGAVLFTCITGIPLISTITDRLNLIRGNWKFQQFIDTLEYNRKELWYNIPLSLRECIHQCLQLDPHNRPSADIINNHILFQQARDHYSRFRIMLQQLYEREYINPWIPGVTITSPKLFSASSSSSNMWSSSILPSISNIPNLTNEITIPPEESINRSLWNERPSYSTINSINTNTFTNSVVLNASTVSQETNLSSPQRINRRGIEVPKPLEGTQSLPSISDISRTSAISVSTNNLTNYVVNTSTTNMPPESSSGYDSSSSAAIRYLYPSPTAFYEPGNPLLNMSNIFTSSASSSTNQASPYHTTMGPSGLSHQSATYVPTRSNSFMNQYQQRYPLSSSNPAIATNINNNTIFTFDQNQTISSFTHPHQTRNNRYYILNNDERIQLFQSCIEGNRSIIEHYIQLGIDPNTYDKKGYTLLITAVIHNHKDIVNFLLSIPDIDIDYPDKLKTTPLMHAIDHGYYELTQLLINHGANIQARDHHGYTPLSFCSRAGFANIIRLLLQSANIDVEVWSKKGYTPLMSAAGHGHVECVKELLHHNADINRRSDANITALYLGVRNNRYDVVRTLLEHNIKPDLNIQNQDGYTPLMSAVNNNAINIVQLLCQYGANVNIRNPLHKGKTALQYAMDKNYKECEHILQSYGAMV